MSDLIPPEAAERVGEVIARATGTVTRRDWQRWAAAVDDLNPIWFDADAARAAGYRDVTCPPLYLQYAVLGVTRLADLRADGSSGASTGALAFPKAPRRMAGGESYEFHEPAYDGDEVALTRRIVSIEQKQGRSGSFVLVTWQAEYRTADDVLLASSTTSMIARP